MMVRIGGVVAMLVCMATTSAFGQLDVRPSPSVSRARPEPVAAPLPRDPQAAESPTDQPVVDLFIRLYEVCGKLPEPAEKPQSPPVAADSAPNNREPKIVKSVSRDGTRTQLLAENELADWIVRLQSQPGTQALAAPRMRLQLGSKGELRTGGELVLDEDITTSEAGETPATKKKTLFFGTSLDATVTQPKPSLMRVALTLEHSALTRNKTGVPGVDARRLATTVELKAGQTVMLSGLKSKRNSVSVTQLPVLGEIPVIGEKLFSKTQTETLETELVVFITPVPLDPNGP